MACTRVILTHCAERYHAVLRSEQFPPNAEKPRGQEKSEVRALHPRQMFVSRMLLDSRIRQHTRTRLLSRGERTGPRETYSPFPFSPPACAPGSIFLPSHEEPDQRLSVAESLGVCGLYYAVGPSSTRRWLSPRNFVHAKQEFREKLFSLRAGT